MYNMILLQASGNAGIINLVFIASIMLVFYFFMLRPQLKKQKEQDKFVNDLKKGKEVVTTGGIFGKITKIDEKVVTLMVDEKVYIKITKSSISKELTETLCATSASNTTDEPAKS
ncbi:MAG: preprotein translocase subunit YajC [Saprospiraceae bacterium]|nr:preprotein translocase subunit YajC [Saprospiraceae bacterium]